MSEPKEEKLQDFPVALESLDVEGLLEGDSIHLVDTALENALSAIKKGREKVTVTITISKSEVEEENEE